MDSVVAVLRKLPFASAILGGASAAVARSGIGEPGTDAEGDGETCAEGWPFPRSCSGGTLDLLDLRKRAMKPFSPGPADAGGLGTVDLNLPEGSAALIGVDEAGTLRPELDGLYVANCAGDRLGEGVALISKGYGDTSSLEDGGAFPRLSFHRRWLSFDPPFWLDPNGDWTGTDSTVFDAYSRRGVDICSMLMRFRFKVPPSWKFGMEGVLRNAAVAASARRWTSLASSTGSIVSAVA